MLLFMAVDRQEVSSRLGVIKPWQADGVAVVDGGVVGHAVYQKPIYDDNKSRIRLKSEIP